MSAVSRPNSPSPVSTTIRGVGARRSWRCVLVALVTVGAGVSAGCAPGERVATAGSDAAVSVAPPASTSMYCGAIAGSRPADVTSAVDAEALATAWRARRTHEHIAMVVAPDPIRASWRVVNAFSRDEQEPALQAAGFDPSALVVEPIAVTTARRIIDQFDHAHCD